jgi:hypothetical protein
MDLLPLQSQHLGYARTAYVNVQKADLQQEVPNFLSKKLYSQTAEPAAEHTRSSHSACRD